ncbi:MAG: hydantoinase/oxoprolinase family protein [Alphaproteobacteria bacterium]
MNYRVGVDIGGTFTDIVFLSADGRLHLKKVSSSSDNYARAIADGLSAVFAETGLQGGDVGEVSHGTTVASNAILEGRGAKTGLITTKGFRDVLEIRRLRMPRLYDIAWEKPPPLVERYLRLEVAERTSARGEIHTALDPEDVERALDRLAGEGIEALAVALINSYANPAHETRIKEIVERRLPGLPVCISSEVLPEIREFERTSTTVINAYILPIVRHYLERLTAELKESGISSPLMIMQSNGGIMTAEAAARMPMHIVESGPAAGVVGSQALARRLAEPKVITFDMGGTTAKASIIEDYEINRATEFSVGGGILAGSRLLTGSGYLLRAPVVDLAEVGAGGGSIVWIDAGGSLEVGPRSAGSSPGPVCYDTGGTEPTITDANVVLGYLNPEYLVGGAVKLNAARARELFAERIARPLGLSLEDAAEGAHRIAASNMIRAIKSVSSERGRDPREYVLFAFGGNGPLFAASLARQLEMRRILVPPAPGLFSAFGLLYADVEHHYVRTYRRETRGAELSALNEVMGQMESVARAQLAAEGFAAEAVRLKRAADLCYLGQSFELTVPMEPGAIDAGTIAKLEEAFAREHERVYGHRAGADEPVVLMSLRLVAQGIPDKPRMPERLILDRGKGPESAAPRRRPVYFGAAHGWLEAPVLGRGDLAAKVAGPAIIEEYDATCVIPPRASGRLDTHGNIVIELEPEP